MVLKWIREQIHLNQRTVQELEEDVKHFSIMIIFYSLSSCSDASVVSQR